jgi:hypothetical protein
MYAGGYDYTATWWNVRGNHAEPYVRDLQRWYRIRNLRRAHERLQLYGLRTLPLPDEPLRDVPPAEPRPPLPPPPPKQKASRADREEEELEAQVEQLARRADAGGAVQLAALRTLERRLHRHSARLLRKAAEAAPAGKQPAASSASDPSRQVLEGVVAALSEVRGARAAAEAAAEPASPAQGPAPHRRRYDIMCTRQFTLNADVPHKAYRAWRTLSLRRAKLEVDVAALQLPAPVQDRLVAIAGSRYDPATRRLKLSVEEEGTYRANFLRAKRLMRDLLTESWLAYPLFVSLGDLPAPPKPHPPGLAPSPHPSPRDPTLNPYEDGPYPEVTKEPMDRHIVFRFNPLLAKYY